MKNGCFVSGIGTNVGKTFVSAGLMLASNATYFKPLQTGAPNDLDRDTLQQLTGLPASRFLPESKAFQAPLSPHRAAFLEGTELNIDDIRIPEMHQPLIVEGAGGLLVPLNPKQTMLDLIQRFQLPVLLVSTDYLGSINHTLLSIQCIKHAQIPLAGLVFTGKPFEDNEDIIAQFHPDLTIWPRLNHLELPFKDGLSNWASSIQPYLSAL